MSFKHSYLTSLQKVPLVAGRAFSSSARQMRNRVAEAQKRFQEDNGHPVHLKGGTFDLLMYRVTMTLTIAGNTDPHVPSSSAAPDLSMSRF
uniref:Cytochrome c oxidase subunit 7A1, mitochondrial n=1 Tax=Cynoglossus semilaevis TaxID=244447 RepID=A0A3P8WB81_CYNSE